MVPSPQTTSNIAPYLLIVWSSFQGCLISPVNRIPMHGALFSVYIQLIIYIYIYILRRVTLRCVLTYDGEKRAPTTEAAWPRALSRHP